MDGSPPPVDFEEDAEASASDEELEQSPFLDPETSAMDAIEPEPDLPVPTTDVNLFDDEEDEPLSKPVEPVVVETAPPPTIEASAADEEEPVQAKPLVEEGQGFFDEEPPVGNKPAEQVRN